jgi:hypothetical protein
MQENHQILAMILYLIMNELIFIHKRIKGFMCRNTPNTMSNKNHTGSTYEGEWTMKTFCSIEFPKSAS